jgi:hypothetical protein
LLPNSCSRNEEINNWKKEITQKKGDVYILISKKEIIALILSMMTIEQVNAEGSGGEAECKPVSVEGQMKETLTKEARRPGDTSKSGEPPSIR